MHFALHNLHQVLLGRILFFRFQNLSPRIASMACTKRTAFLKPSPPPPPLQEVEVSWGVKIDVPSSSPPPQERHVVAFLAPRASPDKAANKAVLPLLDERLMLLEINEN
ncbi:hypothetical protein LIER_31161 [Lithospermum erythrorhizon]|uniref:Uncharacterized protein n=1 Tax=Lithospermum erythrorhizon TaxID=34254 RepID=A0AAV3RU27_LITER